MNETRKLYNLAERRVIDVKKIEIVVKPEKVGIVQLVLKECNVGGVMESKISGHGNQHGENFNFHGRQILSMYLSSMKLSFKFSPSIKTANKNV